MHPNPMKSAISESINQRTCIPSQHLKSSGATRLRFTSYIVGLFRKLASSVIAVRRVGGAQAPEAINRCWRRRRYMEREMIPPETRVRRRSVERKVNTDSKQVLARQGMDTQLGLR